MSGLATKVALGFGLAFAAGVAVGAVATRRGPSPADDTYLTRMTDRYELNADQVRAIRAHLDDEKTRIDAILARLESEVSEEIREARAEAERKIRAELTTAQQTTFDRDRAGD